MRGYGFLALFLLLLATPFVVRMAVVGEAPAARDPDAEQLVIVTPHNQDIRREFQRAFGEWHQRVHGTPVRIIYLVPGGSVDIRRLLENVYGGYRDPVTRRLPAEVAIDMDMVWGGGDFFFDVELKPLGVLQPVKLEPSLLAAAFPEADLAGVRLYDATRDASGAATPQWVGICLSAFGIVYNPDLYGRLGIPQPRTWGDLARPELNGLVALADPAHSGSAAMAFMVVLQRAMADEEAKFLEKNPPLRGVSRSELLKNANYKAAIAAGWKKGMADLLLVAANARYFTDQASQVPNDVGNGQAAAGMAIDFYGRVYQESVGEHRCKVILPTGATAITPDPIAVLHGVKGRRLELAKRFLEFLLSPEGQRLWILLPGNPGGPVHRSLRRSPIRQDVYQDRRGWADATDPYEQAGGFNQRSEWTGAWFSDTRALWTAAWLDTREPLKAAYNRILQISDRAQRDRLLAELADLPVTLADVEAIRSERKQAEKQGMIEEWKANLRVKWDTRFAEHYRAILARAKSVEAGR